MSEAQTADPLATARAEFERAMQRNIKGLSYFTSPAPAVGPTPKDVILSRGTMQLYHYLPMVDDVYRIPLLLVMATTNRGYIFDLAEGGSLVEFLLKQGYDVYMLDWEAPRADEKGLGMEDYVLDFLPSAVAAVQAESGETDINICGYCFGGVLSLLYASLHTVGPLNALATFTTPTDFSEMKMFQAWSDPRFFDVDRMVETFGNVPAEMLYMSFDMLKPASNLAGRVRLMDNLWNDEFVTAFRRMDRWSADVIPLAGRYFQQTTKQLMWENALMKGTMTVGGRAVDYGNIKVPYLHVAALHDHIVPTAASAPLIGMVGSDDKQEIVLKGGHVSLVAGANAVRRLWPQLDQWFGERSV
jgi:polyhydroxyalkanoate synthase subunit PhaC